MGQEYVWNIIAEKWAEFRNKTPSEVQEFLKNKKGKILDLGCGSGRNIIPSDKLKYYGVDFSSEMLKIAEKNSLNKKIPAVFIKADIGKEKLPFKSNFFDAAVFISALHCIEPSAEREKALRELFRVMKKNSEAMITVWRKDAMIEQWKNKKIMDFNFNYKDSKEMFVNWKKDGVNYERYYYFYDEKELESSLKKAGFKIIKPELKNDDFLSRKNIVFYIKKSKN